MQGGSRLPTRAATIKRLVERWKAGLLPIVVAFAAVAIVGLMAILFRSLWGIAGVVW